jgi:hypothetical protein
MKNKSNVISAYNHKGYTVYICDHADGYYGSIANDEGVPVDVTPFRSDIESVKEAAENIIYQLTNNKK